MSERIGCGTATCLIAATVLAMAILPIMSSGQPTITIYTDRYGYPPSDATIEVSLSAKNESEGMSVDVYIGLFGADGKIYTLGSSGWSDDLEPWIENFYVPNGEATLGGFEMARTPFWSFELPSEMPPIGDPSYEYWFAAGLTNPETFDFVSDVSFAEFTVNSDEGEHYYTHADLGDDANDGSWANPWKTITHALGTVAGAEANPVTIHLEGTYSSTSNGETFPLYMENWVSLSGPRAEVAILDAEQAAYHVIYSDGVNDLSIEGCSIKGGKADGTGAADTQGGGIYCYDSSLTLARVAITDNRASASGGGIFSTDGSSITITDCTLKGNSSGESGGGICNTTMPLFMVSCTIEANSSANGGGVALYGASAADFEECTISSNMASAIGGGIVIGTSAFVTIQHGTISSNTAEGDGGGIHSWDSSPTIVRNQITGNRANNLLPPSGGGGGIAFAEGSPVIEGNTITENFALSGGNGGGIHCWEYGSGTIVHNTISDNFADGVGGGIGCANSSQDIIANRITCNCAGNGGGGIYAGGLSSTAIESNRMVGNSTGGPGGGVQCADVSSAFIVDNIIEENTASLTGGGICSDGGEVYVLSNTIGDNQSGMGGGGIYGGVRAIRLNTIAENWTDTNGGGVNVGCARIQGNTITNNACGYGGGGMNLRGSGTIQDNVITLNTAGDSGGGICCSDGSSPNIQHNRIAENDASLGGGIVCVEGSSSRICNNEIFKNTTPTDTGEGGGIYCDNGCALTICNNTIADNVARADGGGGILAYSGSPPTIFDCIIWGNGDDLLDCTATYCCIEDMDAGAGNIHDDPLFVSRPLFGDYYLSCIAAGQKEDSPCIDAGSKSAVDAGIDDRTTRTDDVPDTDVADMGFHYPVP